MCVAPSERIVTPNCVIKSVMRFLARRDCVTIRKGQRRTAYGRCIEIYGRFRRMIIIARIECVCILDFIATMFQCALRIVLRKSNDTMYHRYKLRREKESRDI